MSSISSIQKIRISLGLGLRLSKGNSSQTGNANDLHHLGVSTSSDQKRIPC